MKKEEVNIRENKVEKNKKTGLIIGSIALIFLIGATILCWRFNRKFEVTFDYNNGTKENTNAYLCYHKRKIPQKRINQNC